MEKRTSLENSSDREEKWEKIFKALVKLSENLKKDRNHLVETIEYLNQVIFKMTAEQNFMSAEFILRLGFKERDAFDFKSRYENAKDELADFKELLTILYQKNSEPQDTSDNEVRRLKSELGKCKSDNAALLDEKKFVWNQYDKMERDLSEKLKKKCNEVEIANERVQVLVNTAEELQSSNVRLRTDLTKMECVSVKQNKEISQLLKEMENLKSKLDSETPILRNCTAEAGPSKRRRKRTLNKESDLKNSLMTATKLSAHRSTGGKASMKLLCVKDRSSLRRKATKILTIRDDTPKLWTSSSQAPKLKA